MRPRPLVALLTDLDNVRHAIRARRFAALVQPVPAPEVTYEHWTEAEREVTHALRLLNGDKKFSEEPDE